MIQLINQKLGFCPYLKKTYFKKLGFCPYADSIGETVPS